MNPSRTQNRGEKGLSAGGGVEVDGGDEAVAGVGIGLEAGRGDQGAEATSGRGFGAVAERGVVVDGKDLMRLKPLTDQRQRFGSGADGTDVVGAFERDVLQLGHERG